jgi:hypothetical protein
MCALPNAAADARVHTRFTLAAWGLDEVNDICELIASELTANAVRASFCPDGTPMYVGGKLLTLHVGLFSDRSALRIEVFDQAPGIPQLKVAGDTDESGRGLAMVNTVTRGRWGCHAVRTGKVVWGEVSL